MRRAAATLLLLLPLACKQIDEIPPATPQNAASAPSPARPDDKAPPWLSSEASVFEHVQGTLEQAGFPEVRTAVFRVTEDVSLPSYQRADRTLSIPPFADGPEAMRRRLARMSARHFSGALTFIDAFDSLDRAYDGYRVFLAVAVAHELGHHAQLLGKTGAPDSPESILALESEAIELEQAYLTYEIEQKRLPETSREHYRRAVVAIRDSLPNSAFRTLPADQATLSRAFAQAYLTYARAESAARADGVNPEIDAAALLFAGYTQRRLAFLTKPGRSLPVLARALHGQSDPAR